jgi:hypothetical protein
MPVFTLNQPIETATSTVAVENQLAPGVHTFQLVVVDNDGNLSLPALARMVVLQEGPPPPVAPILHRVPT